MLKRKKAVILAVCLILLLAGKNIILKQIVIWGASHSVGAKVTIAQFSWSVFKENIVVRDLKIYNPAGFPDETLMTIAAMEINYKIGSLISKDPHIDFMAMDVEEVVAVKNKDRSFNINELKITKEAASNPVFPVKIKSLKLNIDQVVHKDYSKGDQPVVKTFEIGLQNKEFKNIKSTRKLVALVLANAIGRTSIKGVKMYALAAFLGPAALPVGFTGVLVGKDHADGEFDVIAPDAYASALRVLGDIGEIVEEKPEEGSIKAKVSAHSVSAKVESVSEQKAKITVSARKLKIPKPNFAGGILYQIKQELNREPDG